MPRYIAFLRAINVGGHVVKMERLRALFEDLAFSNVDTFIASGNVIFETHKKNAKPLEKLIESRLEQELGYEVATFLRSPAELQAIVNHEPFAREDMESAHALHVGFLRHAPSSEHHKRLISLSTQVDDFHVHGREFYWLCRVKLNESKVSGTVLGKALGIPTTTRNITMLRKLAAKFSIK
jgi:uncharacterized protein (DUF1697 family)